MCFFSTEFFLEYNTELDSKAINNTRDMYDACLDLSMLILKHLPIDI